MSSETQPYEAQMLQQLIKNAERIAVVEEKITVIEGRITDIKTEISDMKTELKTELSEVKATADRAEWWLRFIAGAVVLSFFKEQLMSFL